MVKKLNLSNSYSVWEYIIRLLVLILFSLAIFFTFSNNNNPLEGFISASISFFLITLVSVVLLVRDRNWISFFVLSYLIHLAIGTFHYLYFLDPGYFSSNGIDLPLPHDFTVALSAVNEIISAKHIYGLFHYEDFYISHPEILNLISYPFYFFGGYILNIAPLNSFMSVFTSINLYLISKYVLNYRLINLKRIAILSAYFPLSLISSIFYRDVTGIALMSIALVLLSFSKSKIYKYILLIPAIYLFYMQRTIYPVILLTAFILDFIIISKASLTKSKANVLVTIILFIPAVILLSRWSFDLGLSEGNNSAYIEGASRVNYLFLPVKLIMGIIGPFPWTQYFTTGRIEYSYQFADYLQGTLNITIVALIFSYFRYFARKKEFNLINLTGLLLILSGLATTYMHTTYVSIGVLFLIPWIVNSSSWVKLRKYYLITFVFMLVFSLLVTVFFGGTGLGSLWK